MAIAQVGAYAYIVSERARSKLVLPSCAQLQVKACCNVKPSGCASSATQRQFVFCCAEASGDLQDLRTSGVLRRCLFVFYVRAVFSTVWFATCRRLPSMLALYVLTPQFMVPVTTAMLRSCVIGFSTDCISLKFINVVPAPRSANVALHRPNVRHSLPQQRFVRWP